MRELRTLIEISRFYGDDPSYVIAGGGNTSFKNESKIWIKASGIQLAGIDESGFVCLSREKLKQMEVLTFSGDPVVREKQVKTHIKKAVISPENLRPSVETSLHNLIVYSYVVHTHPAIVNGLMCANNAEKEVEARFGDDALYVEYTDPGFVLFKRLQKLINEYRDGHGITPKIILLQNHGIFVSADTVEEVKSIYGNVMERINTGYNDHLPQGSQVQFRSGTVKAIEEHCANRGLIIRAVRSGLIDHFAGSMDRFLKISFPFSPDIIVYCRSAYLFLGKGMTTGQVVAACEQFERIHGYYPKVIIEEKGGLIAVEENINSLDTVLEVYINQMKISYLSESFGGPHFMTPDQISYIDNWEVENYRRKVAKG